MHLTTRAQDLLYEAQVPCYDYSPGTVSIRSLPAILLIVTYLVQPLWSVKSGALTLIAQKNIMHSTFNRSRVWSNIVSSNSRLLQDTSSQPTLTPFGLTDGSVLFQIWRFLQHLKQHTIRGDLEMHNYTAATFLAQSITIDD